MQKKNILIIILTTLIFLSVACLGIVSVYRVSFVTVNAPVVSQEAKAEAEELQKKLYQAYAEQNVFTVDESKAEEIFQEFPYFRMTSFKKQFPNRIVIEATEDVEVFAVENGENSYYILGADGTILGMRSTPVNRSDGANNIVIKGVQIQGKEGEIASNDECLPWLINLCQEMSKQLGGIRKNVLWLQVIRPTASAKQMMFKLQMKEGVVAYVDNPSSLTHSKAEKLVEKYINLSVSQRLRGMIAVTDDMKNVIVDYAQDDRTPSAFFLCSFARFFSFSILTFDYEWCIIKIREFFCTILRKHEEMYEKRMCSRFGYPILQRYFFNGL